MIRLCDHLLRNAARLGFARFCARRVRTSLSGYLVQAHLRGKDGRARVPLNYLHMRCSRG